MNRKLAIFGTIILTVLLTFGFTGCSNVDAETKKTAPIAENYNKSQKNNDISKELLEERSFGMVFKINPSNNKKMGNGLKIKDGIDFGDTNPEILGYVGDSEISGQLLQNFNKKE